MFEWEITSSCWKNYLLSIRNAISDIVQVDFLGLCQKLRNLTLEGNPICTTPSVDATSVSKEMWLKLRHILTIRQ